MNETVLITGASRGIGKAAALSFAKAGYRLALCGNLHFGELETVCDSIRERFETDCFPIQADVSNAVSANELVEEAIARLGRIDVLINNAGISSVGLITDLSTDEWQRVIQTNLSSVFYCSKAVLPSMIRRQNGCIINTSSVFGIYGASCEVAYSASKGGVNAFTRALAKELAPSNIRVNAIAFGAIDTSMNDNLDADEKSMLAEEIPAGRFAAPGEAGDALLHLAQSPEYLTGQIIQFDGGWI